MTFSRTVNVGGTLVAAPLKVKIGGTLTDPSDWWCNDQGTLVSLSGGSPPPPGETVTPFQVGVDIPGAAVGTLGFRGPESALTVWTLTQMASVTAGQVVKKKKVVCNVSQATGLAPFTPGACYVDCKFTGPNSDEKHRIADMRASTAPPPSNPATWFAFCTFTGSSYSDIWAAAVGGHDVVLWHCDLTGIDGVDSYTKSPLLDANVTLIACKTSTRPINPDTQHIDGPTPPEQWSHADGWQVISGRYHTGIGNYFSGTPVGGTVPNGTTGDPLALGKISPIMITQNDNPRPVRLIDFHGNFLEGQAHISQKTGGKITGNFSHNKWLDSNAYLATDLVFSTGSSGVMTYVRNTRWNGSAWVDIRIYYN